MPGPTSPRPALELWAGVECTVARVGDSYIDQLELGGHARRPGDLDLIAGLGATALRYPVLWERTAPDGLDRADWSWSDARLDRLRALGVRPIVGLVHHGSGPLHTSLVDPSFPGGLAAFARAVAERYPWVEDYTPVNEPLTTARFSGLYGHWYPHGRDDRSFVRALIHECRAVALAMQTIRSVNPAARLIQTEDLALTHAVASLESQVEFENARRWLTFDLLCGRVDRDHYMTGYLLRSGATGAELAWFVEHPCPPDVLGLNYYPTSERFLDDRLDRYPPHTHGGNGLLAYADVEAVRVLAAGPSGIGSLLREAWERYGRPLAVTEVHLGCTREEQLRWFAEVWSAARDLAAEGVDVRAVTAWAVLGSYDWDCLVTRPGGRYEPGVFDLRGPSPRPTALAGLIRGLSEGREPEHPALAVPGWWHRPERLLYPPIGEAAPQAPAAAARPLLTVGTSGGLDRALARQCRIRGLPRRLSVADALDEALDRWNPWAVVTSLRPEAEAEAAEALAAACARRGIALLAVSSDLVLAGSLGPQVESDPVAPADAEGVLLAALEDRVRRAHPGALIVRAASLFATGDASDELAAALEALAAGEACAADDEVLASATALPDLVHACLDLLIDREAGLWHLAHDGALTPAGLVRRAAELAGLDPSGVCPQDAAGGRAGCVLASERGTLLPALDEALGRFLHEHRERLDRAARASREEGVGVTP